MRTFLSEVRTPSLTKISKNNDVPEIGLVNNLLMDSLAITNDIRCFVCRLSYSYTTGHYLYTLSSLVLVLNAWIASQSHWLLLVHLGVYNLYNSGQMGWDTLGKVLQNPG